MLTLSCLSPGHLSTPVFIHRNSTPLFYSTVFLLSTCRVVMSQDRTFEMFVVFLLPILLFLSCPSEAVSSSTNTHLLIQTCSCCSWLRRDCVHQLVMFSRLLSNLHWLVFHSIVHASSKSTHFNLSFIVMIHQPIFVVACHYYLVLISPGIHQCLWHYLLNLVWSLLDDYVLTSPTLWMPTAHLHLLCLIVKYVKPYCISFIMILLLQSTRVRTSSNTTTW